MKERFENGVEKIIDKLYAFGFSCLAWVIMFPGYLICGIIKLIRNTCTWYEIWDYVVLLYRSYKRITKELWKDGLTVIGQRIKDESISEFDYGMKIGEEIIDEHYDEFYDDED